MRKWTWGWSGCPRAWGALSVALGRPGGFFLVLVLPLLFAPGVAWASDEAVPTPLWGIILIGIQAIAVGVGGLVIWWIQRATSLMDARLQRIEDRTDRLESAHGARLEGAQARIADTRETYATKAELQAVRGELLTELKAVRSENAQILALLQGRS